MVKNANGGNRSKAMGRKYATAKSSRELRMSSCELEQYGTISKVLGHGMFYVATTHFPQLLGHIRNKFKGRFKRDNQVSVGALVLVGLREWEAPNFKECDLLEVYDASETRQLLKNTSIDLESLHINQGAVDADTSAAATADTVIEFDDRDDYAEDAAAMESDLKEMEATEEESYMKDIVSMDDI